MKGKPKLLRDEYSTGIVNTDKSALEKAKALKNKINKKNEAINDLNVRVEKLELLLNKIAENLEE